MKTIDVGLCVNDHRNGMCAGRLLAAHFHDSETLTLQGPLDDGYCPRFRESESERAFFVSGKKFRFVSSVEWWGNWCWNLYRMEPFQATELANHLRSTRKFTLEVADERLARIYRTQKLLAQDLVAAIERSRA